MNERTIHTEQELLAAVGDMQSVPERHLGDILVGEGKLTEAQLKQALEVQHRDRSRHLGELLVEMGFCAWEDINAALAHKLGIPFVRISDFQVEPQVLQLFSADIALRYGTLPLAREGNRLLVAMQSPLDWGAMEALRFSTNLNIEPVIAPRADIDRELERYYASEAEEDLLQELKERPGSRESAAEEAIGLIAREAQKKPMVRLVNSILSQGITQGASDINIRPLRDRIEVFYRIDGKMLSVRTLGRPLLAPLVSRIKIMGQMNIAERRLPQDGHARVQQDGRSVDLRISVVPTVSGESVVIRVLDRNAGFKPIEELGLADRDLATLRGLLSHNHGMFLVTGPTGSGKSTTLYAVLDAIRLRGDPHIITVEDPVEYDMPGIEQIQTLPAHGYTFAEALRHILRHDPDVVMVGEIRDLETARIANKAALTGHMVLSTLHTNDAASAVTRLVDMGVERYLLSSTLLGVMAQRLVRLNCPECRQPEQGEALVRSVLGVEDAEVFYRGTGCTVCHQTGYRGRAVVCELLAIDDEVGELIAQGASTRQIRRAALEAGMVSLTQNALALARRGETSLEEVYSVRLE